MRKKIIAGNWKMNNDLTLLNEFKDELKSFELDENVKTIICPSFVFLNHFKDLDNVTIYSQNINNNVSGAYTGEISVQMLKSVGVFGSIVGHSERRMYYNETDETVNEKVLLAKANGFNVILCVGESLEERENKKHFDVVKNQLLKALENIKDLEDIVIAYEPIWAIGTGKTASSDDANEMATYIRNVIKELYSDEAEKISILYGGSVKPSNIKELMSKDNIDGALVGGASLKAKDFSQLVNYRK